MKFVRIIAMMLFVFYFIIGFSQQLNNLDPIVEHKIDSLIEIMTLEEKAGQMNQLNGGFNATGPIDPTKSNGNQVQMIKKGLVGSMLNVISSEVTFNTQKIAVEQSRLGIPLIFGLDVIHGYKTIFPIPLAEACSWDLDAIRKSATIAAKETSSSGIHWTFAPMMDISRDARWGRVMEGGGEDTYLGARIAEARIKGFQGDNLADPQTIAACAKHFAAYGFVEGGRDYNSVDISERTLREYILPPFKAAVDAGVSTFMSSFNEIGGITAVSSTFLLTHILRDEWGFNGFVVTDWGTIGENVTHGIASDLNDAALQSVRAGNDMDMESYGYIKYLPELIRNGLIDENLVNESVRRILRVKFALGLFDDPYKYCDTLREKSSILSSENLEASLDMARKSIVLLKNQNNLLPISKSVKSIAVIGPLADDHDTPLGNWRALAPSNSAVSLLDGIKELAGSEISIKYAKGCDILAHEKNSGSLDVSNDRSGFKEAVNIAQKADLIIMALGEDDLMSGEAKSMTNIGLTDLQLDLLKEVYKVNKKVVLVLSNGRPLSLKWEQENIPAIIEGWHLGSKSGIALAEVLFGKYNPSGKLTVTFPRSVGQIPVYYNHKNTGRPYISDNQIYTSRYIDESFDPLYPFGYGISYTTYNYSDFKLSMSQLKRDGILTAEVKITNSGKVKGEEIVQLYLRDIVASATRPVLELKGFKKIDLEPGQSKLVKFEITVEDLKFWTRDMKFEAENGKFNLFVGPNSKELQKLEFDLVD